MVVWYGFYFPNKKSISKKNDTVTCFLLSKVRKSISKKGSVTWFLLSKVRKVFPKMVVWYGFYFRKVFPKNTMWKQRWKEKNKIF